MAYIYDGKKKLPIGIDDFEKLRIDDFYYIDKTAMIRDLLNNWSEVNLFTRPRRFGKSLNMSMLKHFFEIGGRKDIFDGLMISSEEDLCQKYMGKFPVIFVSLKSINAQTYESAREMAVYLLRDLFFQNQFLLESCMLTEAEKDSLRELGDSRMNDSVLCGGLKLLSQLLRKHYNQKVIILIDEYDVPLAKAFENRYYDQMVTLLRGLFEQTLKTNIHLKFAVLTGCMRVSKESIFTGFNNPQIFSITDVRFDEYFGFTDAEVLELLNYYNLTEKHQTVKEWYDGYLFGNASVYCPWDVICYISQLRADSSAAPENYWINTSSNDIVRRFIEEAGSGLTKREIEKLVAGDSIIKELRPELTYRDMYSSVDHIWSVLFTTGYLTQRGKPAGDKFELVIPNIEIRNIFTSQIMELFRETIRKDGTTLNKLCDALKNGDAAETEALFTSYLKKTISIRDTFVKKSLKENFYHGILLGILGVKDSWSVFSNRESGDGYSDILIEIEEDEIGILIEMKYAQDGNLDLACQKALEQARQNRYDEELIDNGMKQILRYGIACYKKKCKVMAEKDEIAN